MKNGRIVYIIDGPDGTGKSTLANKLSDTFKLPIYHLTYFSNPELHNAQFSNALDLLRNSDTGFILDRFIFSEQVYSDVYRDSKYIPLLDDCFNALAYSDVNVILTVPKDKDRYLEDFKKLCAERDEMYGPEKMGAIYDGYNHFFDKKWNFNISRYDLHDIIDSTEAKRYEFCQETKKYEIQ